MPTIANPADAIRDCQSLHRVGRHRDALDLAQSCLAASGDDLDLRWRCFTAIGNILKDIERFDEALDAHSEALATAKVNNDPCREAMSWNNLGVIFLNASAWDLAVECFSRITESAKLARAWSPYVAHGNMALCHLHLDNIREGLLEVNQAFHLETAELININPYSPVAFRHTFVQLGLQSNRTSRSDIERRAVEATNFAVIYKDPCSDILASLIGACIEVAFGNREAGINRMSILLGNAKNEPQVLPDVLLALVNAEKLAGNADMALSYLREWEKHLYPDGPRRAGHLGIRAWLQNGETLYEQMDELRPALKLPTELRRALRQWK